MIIKLCKKCGKEKVLEEMVKGKKYKNGYQNLCKSCQSIYNKKHYKKNRKKVLKRCREYQESNKKKTAAYQKEWYKDNKEKMSAQRKKYREENKEKIAIRMKKYHEKNREKLNTQHKEYYENNKTRINARIKKYSQSEQGKVVTAKKGAKRRAKSRSTTNDLTLQEWQQILKDQDNRCNGCNKKFTEKFSSQKDHILPLSRGGGLTKNNVQALCGSCNSSKGNKLMKEWLAIRGKN